MKHIEDRETTPLGETLPLNWVISQYDRYANRDGTLANTMPPTFSPVTDATEAEAETRLLNDKTLPAEQLLTRRLTASTRDRRTASEFKTQSIGNRPMTAAPHPTSTNQVSSKYEYLGEIAAGGMGRVVAVRDQALRRKVAMKLLVAPNASTSRKAAELLLAEAQMTGQLEHPNIVPIHDVSKVNEGDCYFTMKLVKGETLRNVFKKLGDDSKTQEYSLPRMLAIFQQISNGLGFAHSRGVIHRDLKPQNIMIGEFGEVLIMDWGIAKVLKSSNSPGITPTSGESGSIPNSETIDTQERAGTVLGTISGTVGYMSPEQARGQIDKLDCRSDIYSLGSMLYEMLAGSPPYNQPNIKERLAAAASEMPIESPISRLRKTDPKTKAVIPREVAAIAMKALAPKADDRYQTARQMFDDIQRYLEGNEVKASPDSVVQKSRRWMKRHRTMLRTVFAIVLAVMVAVAGARFLIRRSMISNYSNEAQRILVTAKGEREKKLQTLSSTFAATNDPYADENKQRAVDKIEEEYSTQLTQAANYYARTFDYDAANSNARRNIAEIYMELWRAAQRRNKPELMSAYAEEVANFAGSDRYKSLYKTEIDGDGKLKLTTGDVKAEVFIYRFVEIGQWNRLIPVPYQLATRKVDENAKVEAANKLRQGVDGHDGSSLFFINSNSSLGHHIGQTPLMLDEMPIGNYFFVLKADGYEDLRVPVSLSRQKNLELNVRLLRNGERPNGFSYIPKVWAKLGGPSAGSKWTNFTWKSVDPFYVQTYEVTFGEYEQYLKNLIANGQLLEARKHLPQDFGFYYLTIAGKTLVPHKSLTEGWRKWPVRGVSWLDAQSYASWRSSRDGVSYRLPSEVEWEVASRGTDGRRYTWGEVFWPQAARLAQGYSGPDNNQSNKLFSDESVFGVWDMSGSQAEWCADDFGGRPGEKVLRGNAWGLQPVGLETAFRTSGRPDYFHASTGFRLAMTVR